MFIECNSNSGTVILKAIAGWAYHDDLASFKPEVQYATDGKVIDITASRTSVGAYGDNVAGVRVDFTPGEGRRLVEAFAGAKKQIAIKDGISDGPHLLSARGSTKAGQALLACISKIEQAGSASVQSPGQNDLTSAPKDATDPKFWEKAVMAYIADHSACSTHIAVRDAAIYAPLYATLEATPSVMQSAKPVIDQINAKAGAEQMAGCYALVTSFPDMFEYKK